MLELSSPAGTTARGIELRARPLRQDEVVAVARDNAAVVSTDVALARMERAHRAVQALARSDLPVYGVSTGFGALAGTRIDRQSRDRLQLSLVRSHAAGVGPEVEAEVVRALLLLRCRR